MTGEPLGLPRGSVRALLTILLIACSLVCVLFGKGVELFGPLVGVAIRDYFSHREKQNAEDGPVVPAPVLGGDP